MNEYLKKQNDLINEMDFEMDDDFERAERIRVEILTEAMLDAATAVYIDKSRALKLTNDVYELMDIMDLELTPYKTIPNIMEAYENVCKKFKRSKDYTGINFVMEYTMKRLYPDIEFIESDNKSSVNQVNNYYNQFSDDSKYYQNSVDNSIYKKEDEKES